MQGHPSLSFSHRCVARQKAHMAFLVLLIGALSALLLPGCNTGSGKSGGATTPTNNNTLRYALTAEPTTLDPATVRDGTTIDLIQQIFEGLVAWDANNQIVPNLAEKWDLDKTGTVYTFHLKHGVKFQNGREVTAQDFKYSMDRTCDPATKSTTAADYMSDIVGAADRIHGKPGVTDVSGVKAIDNYTLQITLTSFKPYWLGNLTYPTSYVVCKEAVEANGGRIDSPKSAIGTGPFKLASYKPEYNVTLAANTDYHGGRPKLDYIERPVIIDPVSRLNKYQAGELDYVEIAPSDLDKVNSDPKLKPDLKAYPRAATWYIGLNSAAPESPFVKKEVRQAFAMAIDKKEILRVALKNEVDLADSVVPDMPGTYTPHVKPLPYDPARAKALLAQAGYPDGKGFPALTISFRQDYPQVRDTAQMVARQLKTNLGVDIQLNPMEWGAYLDSNEHRSQALFHMRWAADYLDPQDFLSILLHSSIVVNGKETHPENTTGYSNPEFDRLCDAADVEHDPKKRMDMYHQAEQIAIDDAPWVPLYFQKDLELDKPRVHNIRDSLFGHLPHITTTVTP